MYDRDVWEEYTQDINGDYMMNIRYNLEGIVELEQMGFEFDVEGLNVREMSMEEYANTMGPIWEMSYNHRTDADFYANLKKSIAVLGASYTGIAFAAGGSAAGVAKLSTGTDLVLDSADVVTSLITGDRAGAVVGAVSMVLPEVMEGVAKSGRGFFRSSGDILEGLEETERRTLLDALEGQGFVDVERIEINDDVLRITTKDGVGEISGVSELIEGGSESVQHAVGSANQAQSVLNGIDPQYFNAESRFGGGFYVGGDGDTIIAELAEHGNTAEYAISYDLDLSGQKVLDLTNPEIAAQWDYVSQLTSTEACQDIGIIAKTQGYSVIEFQSYRGNGVNYVIYNNFESILEPRIVTPIK